MCEKDPKKNNAGIRVDGVNNPNWKGGLLSKVCQVCSKEYQVKQVHAGSRFCSMKCVGISQRAPRGERAGSWIDKDCKVCGSKMRVLISQKAMRVCCSEACSLQNKSDQSRGKKNINWQGGVCKSKYTHNWASVSRRIRKRDGGICRNPKCEGGGKISVHHIDYNTHNNSENNLITVCLACNISANKDKDFHSRYYTDILKMLHPTLF